MADREVTIVNPKGLHARAAARLARLAGGFDARIEVERGDLRVSALSIMGLMMLAASAGTRLRIHADGAEAEAALDAVEALILDGFGET